MLHSSSLALLVLSALTATAAAETIHAAVLFSRHGDRTSKVLQNAKLTVVGQNQLFNSGSYWRSRYLDPASSTQILGISAFAYDASQIYAASPDSAVLEASGQAFLQGLYPPTLSENETLANGSSIDAPLDGFQYVPLHTVSTDSPETIWLQASEGCTSYDAAGDEFFLSPEYTALEASTQDFYSSFYGGLLAGVFPEKNVSYKNAYLIYDYLNVGVVHNSTIANAINETDLFQLRTLADSHEWALNANSSAPILMVGGQALAHQLVSSLEAAVSSSAEKNKLNLFYGSYDTFLSFFSLLSLPDASSNFFGLPDYASVLSIELFTDNGTTFPSNADTDLQVRFLFRNGTTQGDAKIYPLFGHTSPAEDSMTWGDFKATMADAIGDMTSTEQWCGICGSDQSFCDLVENVTVVVDGQSGSQDRLSPAVAGVVGAVCALATVGLVAIAAALLGFRAVKKSKGGVASEDVAEKGPLGEKAERLSSAPSSVTARDV